MSKINLLSSSIYNRIAAGEVVERPFSVVKELVENSIDAGADKITVEIQDGGKTLVCVSDNGSGIEKDQLKKALLPHATSKISKISDLDNIMSLGFRGEALASIASVSKITITSKVKDADTAAKIYAEGGVIGQVQDCGFSDGTEISVKNLFYNTPAREKFLKSIKSEENEITAVMARFILGNPQISFKYQSDGKVIYQSFGDGLAAALTCIYGAITDKCYHINTQKNGIEIYGYIGKQNFTKPNRTYQTFFLNGRYINNQTVSTAIHNAYGAYLMKRQYPFYVLSVTMPTEVVDVNVHPNKTDVRFANNQIVYGTIYSVISKVLDGISEALDIVSDDNSKNIQQKPIDIKSDFVRHNELSSINKTDNNISLSDVFKPERTMSIKADNVFSDSFDKTSNTDIFAENKAYIEKLEKLKEQSLVEHKPTDKPLQESFAISRKLNYVGQVLNTYLIMQDGEYVYFADQHAAHEKLLFDKFIADIKQGEVITQSLLIPYIVDVNGIEYNFISQIESTLRDMGIDISPFGNNSFKISAIPVIFADINLKTFFNDILADLNSLKTITVNELLTERIAVKACKAAIKSGYTLKDIEIETLVSALEQNIGLRCPHGRPVVARISRMEIDKWFKRIL